MRPRKDPELPGTGYAQACNGVGSGSCLNVRRETLLRFRRDEPDRVASVPRAAPHPQTKAAPKPGAYAIPRNRPTEIRNVLRHPTPHFRSRIGQPIVCTSYLTFLHSPVLGTPPSEEKKALCWRNRRGSTPAAC